MATFSTKSLHFPGGVPKKPQKKNTSPLRRLQNLWFFGFLVPPQEMATFSTKSLHFPGRVPKKQKKNKDFGLFRPRAFAKTLKSLVVLVFLVPPQEMATFSTKSLHFPGGVPKKPKKKTKILDSSGLAFAKTLKSLFCLIFWYLLRKWQHFLSWLFCLLTTVSYSCISNR